MSPLEEMQADLRKRLRLKEQEKQRNEKKNDMPAVRRNEKSIALLAAKLLCAHPSLEIRTIPIGSGGARTLAARCYHCKTTTRLNP